MSKIQKILNFLSTSGEKYTTSFYINDIDDSGRLRVDFAFSKQDIEEYFNFSKSFKYTGDDFYLKNKILVCLGFFEKKIVPSGRKPRIEKMIKFFNGKNFFYTSIIGGGLDSKLDIEDLKPLEFRNKNPS